MVMISLRVHLLDTFFSFLKFLFNTICIFPSQFYFYPSAYISGSVERVQKWQRKACLELAGQDSQEKNVQS